LVTYIHDRTGRFPQRPHYKPEELDRECESLITRFLKGLHGEVRYPIVTDDLTKLIERDASDLDIYADLSHYGPDVEGVTEFRRGEKPRVLIAAHLGDDERRENRFRTTLTHEYGHVHFHGYLWDTQTPSLDLVSQQPNRDKIICKRDSMIDAVQTDWMEWQAGYVCGAILMPKSAVRALCLTYVETHKLYGMVSQHTSHGSALIQLIVNTFLVSEEAARIRLIKLNLLTVAPPKKTLFD
jgi:Zn-dependent peptidase ImmA (M78 family)